MKKTEMVVLGVGALVLVSMSAQAAASFGSLSISALKQLALSAGFGTDASTAAAVAMAESSGDPTVIGDIGVPVPGAKSYGLWQINSYYHPEFGPDFTTLLNPQVNASAAYSVYRQAGFSFSPWTTFKSGAYVTYLSGAQNA